MRWVQWTPGIGDSGWHPLANSTTEQLGKTAGKDAAVGKATYPAILGLEASREEARKLTAAAKEALKVFGAAGKRLEEIADYMLDREY